MKHKSFPNTFQLTKCDVARLEHLAESAFRDLSQEVQFLINREYRLQSKELFPQLNEEPETVQSKEEKL